MPKNVTQYNVLIASPSDVMNERHAVRQAVLDWNADKGQELSVILRPTMWETDAIPEMGDRPQAIINRQLVDECDFIVGIFWMRLGSPTGVAVSGTAEEIERAIAAKKPVSIYFSLKPINPNRIDIDQHQKLCHYVETLRNRGLLGEFKAKKQLIDNLRRALTNNVKAIQSKTNQLDKQRDNLGLSDEQLETLTKIAEAQSQLPASLVTDVLSVNMLKGIGVNADIAMKLVEDNRMTKEELKTILDTYVNVYFYDPRIHGLDPTRVDLEHTTANINLTTGWIG